MKKIKITQIAKDLNITHGAVSQWFSGKTKPTMDNAIKMNKQHNIPFEAWKDIKSFINTNIPNTKENIKVKNGKNKQRD